MNKFAFCTSELVGIHSDAMKLNRITMKLNRALGNLGQMEWEGAQSGADRGNKTCGEAQHTAFNFTTEGVMRSCALSLFLMVEVAGHLGEAIGSKTSLHPYLCLSTIPPPPSANHPPSRQPTRSTPLISQPSHSPAKHPS